MSSYTLRLLALFMFTLPLTAVHASQDDLSGTPCNQEEEHLTSHARFESQPTPSDTEVEAHPTELGQDATPNAAFENNTSITSSHKTILPTIEDDGFVSVEKHEKIVATFHINGGMFDTLVIPHSTMPYTEITLSNCTCFNPFCSSSFQNNSVLTRIVLNNSYLNLRNFEEKLGEGCGNLSHIDLQKFSDVSVDGQTIITPERFAQLAHPDVLQRILSGKCELYISNEEREGECYSLDEMKDRFLSSVLHLRSLTKAKETVSTYQAIIDTLSTGVSCLDPSALAGVGFRAAITAYTGM